LERGAGFDAPEVAAAVLADGPSFSRSTTVGHEDEALHVRWCAGKVSLASKRPRVLARLLEALPAAEAVAELEETHVARATAGTTPSLRASSPR
jgi:hypothetical protein